MGNFKKVYDYPGFSDVYADKWYANDVREAYELGLIRGEPGSKFNPEGHVTVAEALTMASRIYGIYSGEGFTLDSSRSPWYTDAVEFALDIGIITESDYTDYEAEATRADLYDELLELFLTLDIAL